jgi:hypothetical protein
VETWEVVSKHKGEPALMCKHCKRTIVHPGTCKDRNTSAGLRHLESCHPYQASRQPASVTETEQQEFWRARATMTRVTLCEYVLRIVIASDLPFHFAENPGFRRFLQVSFPQIPRPTRKMIAMQLEDRAEEAKVRLRELFAGHTGKISLALDGWNSRNNKDFLGIRPSQAMYRED